jgi:DNA-binding response OmpR family regulator
MPTPRGRILCTEDDPGTRELLAFILTNRGFDVTCTESSDHAIELAKAQQFDLYLLDSWMPRLSGIQLTKKLREFDVKTPILFYSGNSFDSDKEDARLAGAQGYLVKPVDNDVLIAEVVRLISDSKVAIHSRAGTAP